MSYERWVLCLGQHDIKKGLSAEGNVAAQLIDGKVLSQAIAVVLVTPLNFVGNKLWSFRRAQG